MENIDTEPKKRITIEEDFNGEDEDQEAQKPLLPKTRSKPSLHLQGGLKTIPFILVNESLEKVASSGVMPNMIRYLMDEYHMEMTTGTYILNLQASLAGSMPLFGAFLADSFSGRFSAIGFGSLISLLGMALLWSTSMIPQARPPPCSSDNSLVTCSSPTTLQLMLLCSAFGLMSIGAGGIRGTSLAFGLDQLSTRPDILQKHQGILERFYGVYYASTAFSFVIAFTFIVYLQEHLGWQVGFGVPVLIMFISALAFFLASPFYVKLQPKSSLVAGLFQVIVVAYKNRHLELPPKGANALYHYHKGAMFMVPSEKLRFLNKACIIRDPDQQEFTNDGKPWNLCTVDQVEELKALLKVIPLWSSGMIMSINVSVPTFGVLQTKTMDRHLTPSFEIPIGSFSMFIIIAIIIWIILYDRVIIPLASAIMGRHVHLSNKQKMGLGIFFSGLSMAVTGVVESIRRSEAIRAGYSDDPNAVIAMSALWLIPQNFLGGFAEALNIIGQIEFFVGEFPKSMSSIAANLGGIGSSFAALLASLLMNAVDQATRRGGKTSWVSSNINRGHYDYFFWILAGLSAVNLVYFFVCCSAYGPCEEERVNATLVVAEEEYLIDQHDQPSRT